LEENPEQIHRDAGADELRHGDLPRREGDGIGGRGREAEAVTRASVTAIVRSSRVPNGTAMDVRPHRHIAASTRDLPMRASRCRWRRCR